LPAFFAFATPPLNVAIAAFAAADAAAIIDDAPPAAMPLMLSPCHYALLYAIFSFSCRRHFAILRRWLIFFFFIFAD
jgi:hypothetical protein